MTVPPHGGFEKAFLKHWDSVITSDPLSGRGPRVSSFSLVLPGSSSVSDPWWRAVHVCCGMHGLFVPQSRFAVFRSWKNIIEVDET